MYADLPPPPQEVVPPNSRRRRRCSWLKIFLRREKGVSLLTQPVSWDLGYGSQGYSTGTTLGLWLDCYQCASFELAASCFSYKRGMGGLSYESFPSCLVILYFFFAILQTFQFIISLQVGDIVKKEGLWKQQASNGRSRSPEEKTKKCWRKLEVNDAQPSRLVKRDFLWF
nr:hypothetical protein Iba_chr05cCG0770 [Ipomoea batatas]